MYRELILQISQGNRWVKIQPPCLEEEIKAAEEAVGHPFPRELKELLQELNGDSWCLLSAQQMIENVERNRTILLPLFRDDFSEKEYLDRVDRFIFFATNGCGDYYGYRADSNGLVNSSTIYLWEHEDIGEPCCWRPVASSLTGFITRYYKGEI